MVSGSCKNLYYVYKTTNIHSPDIANHITFNFRINNTVMVTNTFYTKNDYPPDEYDRIETTMYLTVKDVILPHQTCIYKKNITVIDTFGYETYFIIRDMSRIYLGITSYDTCIKPLPDMIGARMITKGKDTALMYEFSEVGMVFTSVSRSSNLEPC